MAGLVILLGIPGSILACLSDGFNAGTGCLDFFLLPGFLRYIKANYPGQCIFGDITSFATEGGSKRQKNQLKLATWCFSSSFFLSWDWVENLF